MDENSNKRPWLSKEEFIKAIQEYKKNHNVKVRRLNNQQLSQAIKEYLDRKNNNAESSNSIDDSEPENYDDNMNEMNSLEE